MKTKILLRARWLLCTMLAVFLTASAWAETVTYTVSTATAVTATGTAPDGSSATLAGSGTLNSGFIQCTASQNKTLTLSGFNGYKITAITISVKSNSKKGSGSFSVTAGSTTLAEITTAAFNDGSWNGTYSTSAVDKVLTMSDDDYEIQENEDVTFTLAATVNSLYIQSWTITYESVSGGGETKTLSAVDIEGISTMTKKTYETTDHLDLSELTVKGTYSDNSEQTFTSGITWKVKATSASLDEFTPETFTLTTDMTSVWVQATVNSVSSPWTEISGLTVSEHTVTPGTYSIE